MRDQRTCYGKWFTKLNVLPVSLFNKIWDDSGEGVPGTNVYSSGKGLRPFLVGRFY